MNEQENKQKSASQSFLSLFVEDVQQLNHNFALFVNSYSALHSKVGSTPSEEDVRRISKEESETYINLNNVLKYYLSKSFITFKAVSLSIKSANLEIDENDLVNLEKIYNKIKLKTYVELADVESYIFTINSFIVSRLMQNILINDAELRSRMLEN